LHEITGQPLKLLSSDYLLVTASYISAASSTYVKL
jgi:hypothetical protein